MMSKKVGRNGLVFRMGILLVSVLFGLMMLGGALAQGPTTSGSAIELEVGNYISQDEGTAPAYVAGNAEFFSSSGNFISGAALGNMALVFIVILLIAVFVATFVYSKFKKRSNKMKRMLRIYLVVALILTVFAVLPAQVSALANNPPVADAGPDQNALVNQVVGLQGSATDPDNDPIAAWIWSIESSPSGSSPTLVPTNASDPTFTGDLPGDYVLALMVYDGLDFSLPDYVMIHVYSGNLPPIANAGPDQNALVNQSVGLQGSATDPDGDPILAFFWGIDSSPSGSNPSVVPINASDPTFIGDLPGDYVLSFVAFDGFDVSLPDYVTIHVSDTNLPTVPGCSVETYAPIPGPASMWFGLSGELYVGIDNRYVGGGPIVPDRIRRIGVGGSPVEEFGDPIWDPDTPVVDVTGKVSGTPGAILVGGFAMNVNYGHISMISPDGTSTSYLFGPTTVFTNPQDMVIDSTGRLIFGDPDNANPGFTKVYQSTGDFPTVLFDLGPGNYPFSMALDTSDRIFISGWAGKIFIHDASGVQLVEPFTSSSSVSVALAVGLGDGPWGDDLYALTRDTGELLRFEIQQNPFQIDTTPTVIGTGFALQPTLSLFDLAFGPDNALYACEHSVYSNNWGRILKITPLNQPPTITNIDGPIDPIKVGDPVDMIGTFTDPDAGDTHSAIWDWGDGSESEGDVIDGTVTGSHLYTNPGVYTITLTVEDAAGESDTETNQQYVVVFDPTGAFITGGGQFDSPAGAYKDDLTLTGKAGFGFVSKYQKGATTPGGNTQFRFHAGDLSFKSDSYDWLLVAGKKGMFKGTGTINGEGSYKFIISAIDGDMQGGDGTDKFRIKIWEEDELGNEIVIYDNNLGGGDDADPTTALTHGSIKIHKG
jgi:hypothetical protein